MAIINLFRLSKFKLRNVVKKTLGLWIKTSNISIMTKVVKFTKLNRQNFEHLNI
jgi:hypothetical protein